MPEACLEKTAYIRKMGMWWILPVEFVDEVKAECCLRTQTTTFDQNEIENCIDDFIEKELYDLDESLYKECKDDRPEKTKLLRALNLRPDNGVYILHKKKTLLKLLARFAFKTNWLEALELLHLTEDDIKKESSRQRQERLVKPNTIHAETDDFVRSIDPVSKSTISEIEALIKHGKYDAARKLCEEPRENDATKSDYVNAIFDFFLAEIIAKQDKNHFKRIEILKKSLESFERYKDVEYLFQTSYELADAYFQTKNYGDAEKYGLAYVRIKENGDNMFMAAWANYCWGCQLKQMSRIESALEFWNKAIQSAIHLTKMPDTKNVQLGKQILVKCYMQKCIYYGGLGDILKARTYSVKALKLYNDLTFIENDYEIGILYYHLAHFEFIDNGESEKIQVPLQEAKKIFEKTGQYSMLAECLELELRLETLKQDNEKVAINIIKVIEQVILKVSDPNITASLLDRIAESCRVKQLYDYSQKFYLDLLDLALKHDMKEMQIVAYLGLPLHVGVELASANKRIYMLLDECAKENSSDESVDEDQTHNLHKVADLYVMLNERSKALILYTKILKEYSDNDIHPKTLVLMSMGDIHAVNGDAETAVECHRAACNLVKGTVYHDLNTKANLYCASVLIFLKEFTKAQSHVNVARGLIKEYHLAYFEENLKSIEQLLERQ